MYAMMLSAHAAILESSGISALHPVFADPVPQADDVVAGSWGALIWIFLIVAAIVLFRSLSKQLKRVSSAKEAGVYDRSESSAPNTAPNTGTE